MDEAELGSRTGGLWTTADARDAGLSRAHVRGRLARGEWQAVRRGVLTDGGVVLGPQGRGWTAVLAVGGPRRAAAAGRTAARLHGLPLIDDADPLLRPTARQGRHDDVVSRRPLQDRDDLHPTQAPLVRSDLVVPGGGPIALSPLWTLVDLARLLSHEALVCALDDALRRGLVTAAQLDEVVQQRSGRRDVEALRRAVAAADGRAESPLETLSRLLLLPALPDLVPQVVVLDRTGRVVARLDLADEQRRFAVEADGARWHGGGAALAADRRRERRLEPYGWAVERVTWADVRRDGVQTRDRVVRAARRSTATSLEG